jgi:hypothetical protein
MIVWGGYFYDASGHFTKLNTGGRYRPSSDAWTATATTGAPSPRMSHAAVWTGSEMIVWGGLSGIVYLNSGGRYAPSTDSWTETTTTGAPSPRTSHAAVWTGSEMIVWGGRDGIAYLDSGGRYCVSSCASPHTWYQDADADGFGIAAVPQPACDQPEGFAAVAGDCDDTVSTCAADCASDTDSDAIRDCEDTCLDVDVDGYGSPGGAGNTCLAEDNCPSVANGLQLDTDSDLVGDACDCGPEDAGNAAMLGPAAQLRFTSRSELAWNPPADVGGGELRYDVLRATSAADWQSVLCLETDTDATSSSDTETPAAVFYYLVRVQSACGENLGVASGEERRVAAACGLARMSIGDRDALSRP